MTGVDEPTDDRRQPAVRAWRVGFALAVFVAFVWACNGLVFKLLNGLPRHLEIVQSVPGLGGWHGVLAVRLIGVGEVLLAGWVLSGLFPRQCAAFQVIILLCMNGLELAFARSHLLTPLGLVPINLVFLTLAWCAAELRTRDPFYWLRRHPFAVSAWFDDSLVLTYALPEAALRPLLPPGLRLNAYRGFGFVAVAMVRTRRLRPAGFPAVLGQDFVLIGYRIFATFRHDGRTRRGLFILRSDADRRLMVWTGNLLTHYRYRLSRASITRDGRTLSATCHTDDGRADVSVRADLAADSEAGEAAGEGALPAGSVFASARDARRFAGPLPFTFDYERATHSIVVIKGERQSWSPRLVPVTVERLTLLDAPPFSGHRPILCSAFHVRDIAYRWRRGVRVPLAAEDGTAPAAMPVEAS